MAKTKLWSKEKAKQRKQLEEMGDHAALRRKQLGLKICDMREAKELTQQQAANLAKITRQEWNRIENGRHLPRRSNIESIACALDMPPAVLFKRAGYAVPEEFEHYDTRQAQRDLEVALKNSTTLVEFVFEMHVIWQEFQQLHTGARQRLIYDLKYAQVLATILEGFSPAQQLQLAREIVERFNPRIATAYGINNQRFFDYIDKALAELDKQLSDKDPPLINQKNSGEK